MKNICINIQLVIIAILSLSRYAMYFMTLRKILANLLFATGDINKNCHKNEKSIGHILKLFHS